MSPIKNLTEIRRIPRIGKIHTGIKKRNAQGIEYPTAVDYFVFPPEWLERVRAVYSTDKPKSLPIIIPVEDEEKWANQYYRAYSRTRGLLCKGDGETANRLIDLKTGDMATHESIAVEMRSVECYGRDCPYYEAKKCRRVMMLQFMIPNLGNVGVWQLDTGSINAILNINGMAAMLQAIYSRVSMIPLELVLESQIVKTPEGKQRTMPILKLRINATLQEALSPGYARLSLPAGEEAVEPPDEDYPELIAPDAQAPFGEEPDPEFEEMLPVDPERGKPEVKLPRRKSSG